ncbi:hypothetical protein ccbrp13_66870 [Ktedonobacteria bacterium brp13]|nr:hypothetical protein ccbrp13_66870 [Ktedonobacteria bacterium brp13]
MLRTRVAYTTFEQTIIEFYNDNVLTLELLDALAGMYRGMKVNSAGSNMLITCDGLDLHQVCIGLVDPTFVLIARGSKDDDDEYWERELKAWSDITTSRWGWD